jgi:hypothetical protein
MSRWVVKRKAHVSGRGKALMFLREFPQGIFLLGEKFHRGKLFANKRMAGFS